MTTEPFETAIENLTRYAGELEARVQGAELAGMLKAIAAIELIERNLPPSPIRDIQENTLQIVTRNLRKAIEQQMAETKQ